MGGGGGIPAATPGERLHAAIYWTDGYPKPYLASFRGEPQWMPAAGQAMEWVELSTLNNPNSVYVLAALPSLIAALDAYRALQNACRMPP